MRGDPFIIAAVRLDVGAGCNSVCRAAMPLAAKLAAELRLRTISHDEAPASDFFRAISGGKSDAPHLTAFESHVDGPVPFGLSNASIDRNLPNGVIEFKARGGAAVIGQVAAWPAQVESLSKPGSSQPVVTRPALQEITQAKLVELSDRPRGETVTARLVTRKGLGIGEQHIKACAGSPRGSG